MNASITLQLRARFLIAIIAILSTLPAAAEPADESGEAAPNNGKEPAPQGTVKTLPDYQVAILPNNIAPTAPTQPQTDIKVVGQPRNSEGHPCTLLDKEDVDGLKHAITTNKEAIDAFKKLQTDCDARLSQPLGVPIAQNGAWPGGSGSMTELSDLSTENSAAMVDMGMMYQLTGDQKYADYAKKMILTYADNYNAYGHPPGWTKEKYRSAHDGRLTGQFLDDGFWLCRVAFAYDLVYSLPSWTTQERTHVREDLLRAVAAEFYDPIETPSNYLNGQHNRSALCTSGVLMAGYASEDQAMINDAMYGDGGSKEKPTGGLFKVHWDECILPDGLWIEGAPGYQISIVGAALTNDAETLWHHGIDMYRYGDGKFKRLLDSAIVLAYPDAKMTEPKLHDTVRTALISDKSYANNEAGLPYECGYRRYQDPSYLPIINNATKLLSMTVHAGPPSLFLDLPAADTIPPRPVVNANFYSVGYGVLRVPTPDGCAQLLQEFGVSAGHGHPSKLAFDLYALGEPAMPLPGVIFPYGDPLDPAWFWTTVSNCTLVVDEQNQLYSKNKYQAKDDPEPVAQQLVFAPASTIGMQRASSNTIQPGITEDRALFLTPKYLADIFGAFDTAPHTYDLAWHIRGTMTTSLKTAAYKFPAPVKQGYSAIGDPSMASTDQPWDATATLPKGKPIHFFAPGGTSTDVIIGTGHFLNDQKKDEHPVAFIQRRTGQNSVLFCNAADISGDATPYLKNVAQEGSFELGYGLLKIGTADGTDICFSSYRPGNYNSGDFSTDAAQAFVRMNGKDAQAIYLAGGTHVKTAGGAITRSEPGLAYFEKTASGIYIVGNPSPAEATVTVTLPALASLKAYTLDENGKQTGPATVTKAAGNSFAINLKANSQIEFAP